MSSTFVDGVTPLDASHLNALQAKAEKAAANGYASLDSGGKVPVGQLPAAVAAVPTVTYAATPPGSPANGDLWYLPADAANGIVWQFRYNAGSASAYKWEFVGGSSVLAEVPAAEQTASTTYVALFTPGPIINLPRAGNYQVEIGFRTYINQNGVEMHMSYDIGAVAASDSWAILNYTGSSAGSFFSSTMNESRKHAITAQAGDSLVSKYLSSAGALAWFVERWMTAMPVRVS